MSDSPVGGGTRQNGTALKYIISNSVFMIQARSDEDPSPSDLRTVALLNSYINFFG